LCSVLCPVALITYAYFIEELMVVCLSLARSAGRNIIRDVVVGIASNRKRRTPQGGPKMRSLIGQIFEKPRMICMIVTLSLTKK